MSVTPCTLACPRKAFTPPPGRPMLPSKSWIMAMVRMFCDPTECCVQPSAYRIVITLFGAEVPAMCWQTVRNASCGVPVILLTSSGV